ncbi:MAG: anaerobic glycerol-3-phosphate dehydrogenase subunit B [Spirochaetes bacterium]|nr:MAG: anaerobic glycerol-3-phosphate dehydrogenase subunit B [Spirochaetota bacterium]
MKYDLIIIGAGLSGFMAAKRAAEGGLNVLILSKGLGVHQIFSGCIDLLGYYPEDNPRFLESPFEGIQGLTTSKTSHPYFLAGIDDIIDGLNSFLDIFENEYCYIEGKNQLIPTSIGTLKPSYLIPITMIDGAFPFKDDILLLGIKELQYFSSPLAALNLKRYGNVRSNEISIYEIINQKNIYPVQIANLFDKAEFREKFITLISKKIKGVKLVGMPAILGRDKFREAINHLESELDVEIFEIPTLPPSIPGYRLYKRFRRYLDNLGVEIRLGVEVIKGEVRKGKIVQLLANLREKEEIFRAKYFLLTTGRFISNGLKAKKGTVSEPIFNLPLYSLKDKEKWFNYDFFYPKGHMINNFGVMVDNRFFPVDEKGDRMYENLKAAGSVLAYHNSFREKSGAGIAITTGYSSVSDWIKYERKY